MISRNELTFCFINETRRRKCNKLLKSKLFIFSSISTLLILIFTISAALANETTSQKPNTNLCPKNWIHLSNKCYKINHNPRNYESAKGKCFELTAQMAIIEDESGKEKESQNGLGSTLLTYLSSEQRKEQQTRQYYINLSSELLHQYQERLKNGYYQDSPNSDTTDRMESDLSMSDLWIPRDDPSLSNISIVSANVSDGRDYTAFVLAYSKYHKRWGIVPINPTRRMSAICERPVSMNLSASHHHLTNEFKSIPDLSHQTQPSSSSSSNSHSNTEIRGLFEKEPTSTTTPPDTSNMLFRETPQNQSIILGSTAEMRCSPMESDSSLSWTFNGKNLTQTNRVKAYSNGTLRIEHARNTDDGDYTCTVHTGLASDSKTAKLEIVQRPHQPEYITAELVDKQLTSVRIKWTPGFNGNSPIQKYLVEMRTVKDGYESDMNSLMSSASWEVARANISADHTSVIIPDLKPAKKYIFRVTATNRVGTGDSSLPTRIPIEVPVQPPSMPPENLTGVPKSSTSIAIQWSPPPVDSQNGVIKGYRIRHKLAGYATDTDWYNSELQDATHLTYVLDDLIVWQNYEIQVAAENDRGVGPFSSSICVKSKEGKPDKGPREVNAHAESSVAIKVNWTPPPPQHINGLNQGYKVQAWLDVQMNQLAKELVVPHNTISPYHSAIIDGLAPYTDYFISVKCFTGAGDGPPNDEIVGVKTKQDLPEAVPVLEFAEVLDRSLRVIWKAPVRINGELDHYTLEYWESANNDKRIVKKEFPAGATEARITDLSPQTSYNFKIYPFTKIGSGPSKSNHVTTSVPPVLPEPPSNLVCSNIGPYSVTINFNPGFDGNALIEKWIAEAQTQARTEHGLRWQNIYVSTNHTHGSNSVIIRNLRPFTRYKIRLTPVNVVGPSRYPSESTNEFQTAQIEPEQPPRDLAIDDIRSTSVVAHWSPLANNLWLGQACGYNLTWSETNNPTLVMHHLVNDTRADSYLVKDLEEYTEYSFKISAVNEAGSSPTSESLLITTLEDVPSSGPTNLTAHALSPNAVSVDWNAIPKRHRNGVIKGYKIQYQALKADAPLQHKTVEDNSTRHVTLNDLKPFTTYHLAVAAYSNAGDGVYSNVVNVQTLEDTPGKPQNLSNPTFSQTTARILWDPPEDSNGNILGYKVSYHAISEGSKEVFSHELHQTERTFKATNLKPDTHYVFTVTAKTKEGWGQQASLLLLRSNLPFYRESWFVILCACSSIVITIIITALLFIQTKSYKYKQNAMKSTSQDRLGDAGFSIDEDALTGHYNNGFGLLSHSSAHHKRSTGALSHGTANFTLPKTPPRPHPGSVVYSEGDDDVFEDYVEKPGKSTAGTSNYDSSGDSLTEKPSEISSSTAPDSDHSVDDEYANMANKHFVNHYANVNGTLRGQKVWKKSSKQYSSSIRTKPKLPQRPAPKVPHVPSNHEMNSSGSDNVNNQPIAGTSGVQSLRSSNSVYGESSNYQQKQQDKQAQISNQRNAASFSNQGSSLSNGVDNVDSNLDQKGNQNLQQQDMLDGHIVNLNGGRIIVDNMAGSRAPLPGFTSFV